MNSWRKLLALLGLSTDARVHVRARGIDVVITGEPELVRHLLGTVTTEIEAWRRREKEGRRGIPGRTKRKPKTVSEVVRPSDLDDMDSPYAIPEHRTVPPAAGAAGSEPLDSVTPIEHETSVDDDGGEREVTAIDVNPSSSVPIPNLPAGAIGDATTQPPSGNDTTALDTPQSKSEETALRRGQSRTGRS